TNADFAEWLALEAEEASGHLHRALRRASRAAFLWPREVIDLVNEDESLQQLSGVGPYLERMLKRWCEAPPPLVRPPLLRRDFMTLAAARKVLAQNPNWKMQYKGDLQMHSTWSDGAGSIAGMAQAAQKLAYEYIGITDHSEGLKIAGGIGAADLAKQAKEIEALNAKFESGRKKFRVLKSIEMNLSPDGSGDMDAKCLGKLDLVVGSFHSRLRVTEDQTARYLAAIRNSHVNILGHPRGRIYNHRLGLKADWARVFAEAAKLDKAVEVDSYPDRQDLNLALLKIAKKEGVRIAIDTDAHAPEQLGWAELGLATAMLAKIPAERVVNFMAVEELLKWAR
ncbi:MAG TPA: PHP domain-containing protein, partial [Verrucomicrobiae bacterium]